VDAFCGSKDHQRSIASRMGFQNFKNDVERAALERAFRSLERFLCPIYIVEQTIHFKTTTASMNFKRVFTGMFIVGTLVFVAISISVFGIIKVSGHTITALDLQAKVPNCRTLPKTKLVLSDVLRQLAPRIRQTTVDLPTYGYVDNVTIEMAVKAMIENIPDETSCGFFDKYLNVYSVDVDYEELDRMIANEYQHVQRYLKMILFNY
jgi:hypothetical protein